MIKLIIFDWDDVFVVGAIQGYYACYRKALSDFTVYLDESELERIVKDLWGQPHQIILKELLIKSGKEADLTEIIKKYKEYKASSIFLDQLKFIEGGRDFLLKMSRSYTLAIATSQQRTLLIDKIFPMFGVPEVFTVIMSSHELKDPIKAKPHPYMIEEIMHRTGIPKEQTVMVGDAKNDVLMAQAAGVTPIVVLTGHLNKKEAEDLDVKYIIEDVTKIEEDFKFPV